jgi:hypothetical protein
MLSVDFTSREDMEANCIIGVVVNRKGLNDEVTQSQSASAPNPQNNKSLLKDCCYATISLP